MFFVEKKLKDKQKSPSKAMKDMFTTLSHLKTMARVVSVLPGILQQLIFVKTLLPSLRERHEILQTHSLLSLLSAKIARYSLNLP